MNPIDDIQHRNIIAILGDIGFENGGRVQITWPPDSEHAPKFSDRDCEILSANDRLREALAYVVAGRTAQAIGLRALAVVAEIDPEALPARSLAAAAKALGFSRAMVSRNSVRIRKRLKEKPGRLEATKRPGNPSTRAEKHQNSPSSNADCQPWEDGQ